jgi:hypothetical protein
MRAMDLGLVSPTSDTSLYAKFGGLTAPLNSRHRQQPEPSNKELTLRAVSEGRVESRRESCVTRYRRLTPRLLESSR